MAVGELCLIDKDISSLLEVSLKSNITSLNLHCNRLSKIEGLTTAWHIRHLDLSSNYISCVEGLSSLSSLCTLNLSCNSITKVEGLRGLRNLTKLNLAYNQISDLTGLLHLHGADYRLKHLQLHSNLLDSINHLLKCMVGLSNLRNVTLSMDGADNPVCSLQGYREMVLQNLPQVCALDGEERQGHCPLPGDASPLDFPGLEDFLEFLNFTDSVNTKPVQSDALLPKPQIDELLNQFQQHGRAGRGTTSRNQTKEFHIQKLEQQALLGHVPDTGIASRSDFQKAKRDTDQTSESECDSGKEKQWCSRIPCSIDTRGKKLLKDTKDKRSDSEPDTQRHQTSKLAAGSRRRTAVQSLRCTDKAVSVKRGLRVSQTIPDKSPHQTEKETYRAIVEERDQERERRWKAEQAVKKLTEQVKRLQMCATEEKELQNMTLQTTNGLKEVLLKERLDRVALQAQVEILEGQCRIAAEQLEQLRKQEDQHKKALRSVEECVSQEEVLRARQKAEEMQRKQELENKCAVFKREAEMLRALVRQHKKELHQLQEVLTSREEVHRKELSVRLVPGGAAFQEAVRSEVAVVEQRHAQKQTDMEQKLADAQQKYTKLEDEFRMALTIEAKRFSEVKEGFEHVSTQLSEVKAALTESQQREKQSGSLVQELTAMVKEQKARIAELAKDKQDAIKELKSLEAESKEGRSLSMQLELLKKEKTKLVSQLTAQDSLIEGIRAERMLWGQELAQQGASLAQDRGRLEAKIEVLTTELDIQKKQNEKDNDALRIKAKLIDDQTETIRKLKEVVQERDEQLRTIREENVRTQRKFQQQLEKETASATELQNTVEKCSLRNQDLKQQLLDKETEIDELKEVYSVSSRKWQDKADLLTRLESQVKRMKEGFDAKEKALLEEKDKASQAHKAAVEKLHCVDDAFRRQLESIQASHQAELLQLVNDKQKHLEQANQKVFQVEEEMRQLLEETERNKRAMEEKMRRLTSVLKDL